jgi:hypothetical protein
LINRSSAAPPTLDALRRRAAGLVLPSSRQAAERRPDVRILPPNPTAADLDGLTRCFSGIYGSSERGEDGRAIWGEGWRCRWCGVKQPFTAGQEAVGPCPSCGAEERTRVNDLDATRAKLANALRPRMDWHPVACVLERAGQILGFAFGAVTTPRRAAVTLGDRLAEYAKVIAASGARLDPAALKYALPAANPVFYMDELCVELHARNGFAAAQGLASVLFAGAAELGARGVVGFTTKRAAPFRLIAPGGGEITVDLGELVVFRFEDILPITSLLHHLSEDEVVAVLAAGLSEESAS